MKTIRLLENYSWPGNVRELGNTITQILTDCPQKTVEPIHLDAKFFNPSETPEENLHAFEQKQDQEKKEFLYRALVQANWNRSLAAKRAGASSTKFFDLMGKFGIERPEKDLA